MPPRTRMRHRIIQRPVPRRDIHETTDCRSGPAPGVLAGLPADLASRLGLPQSGNALGAAALTEALRWGAGIGLALTLGRNLRQPKTAARYIAFLAAVMALAGVGRGFIPNTAGWSGRIMTTSCTAAYCCSFFPSRRPSF